MARYIQTLLRSLLLSSLCYQLTEAYLVEVNIVVDDMAMNRWREISGKSTHDEFREELESIFVEVSELYTSLKHYEMSVKFEIKNQTLDVSNVVSSPYGEIGKEGLGQFRTWMFERKKFEKGDWEIALLFTGNYVVGDSKNPLGFGQIDRVCSDWGVGMIEFKSQDFRDAYVITHEIGHILGANHDGFKDMPNVHCDPHKNYIMTPNTPVNDIHHFEISYCSYNYFYTAALSGHWECLLNGADADAVAVFDVKSSLTVDASFNTTSHRLGELESADDTCRRELDQDAFFDRASHFRYGDSVCTSLVCNNGAGQKRTAFAPQGLYCGKNKQCIRGKCLETPAGKSDVSDECPFGDSPKIDYKGYKSCDSLPLHYCGIMKDACCHRCGNVVGLRDADNACATLVKTPKATFLRGKYNGNGYGDGVCRLGSLVCATGKMRNKKRTESWQTAPDGMACGYGKRCQNHKCLPTEEDPPTIPDICPFGDQSWDWWKCREIIDEDPDKYCNDPGYKRTCCAYCQYYQAK